MPAVLESKIPSAAADLKGWQEQFDFFVPKKATFRADEVAELLGCSLDTIERLYDLGKLNGHDINAHSGSRRQIRYHRDSIVLFLAERASYRPDDELMRLFEIVMKRPHATVLKFYELIGNALKRLGQN